jgi:hypothetical protein
VAAILIQPWNWIRISAAVRGHRLLAQRRIDGRGNCEWEQGQCTRFQDVSATPAWAWVVTRGHWFISVMRNYHRVCGSSHGRRFTPTVRSTNILAMFSTGVRLRDRLRELRRRRTASRGCGHKLREAR